MGNKAQGLFANNPGTLRRCLCISKVFATSEQTSGDQFGANQCRCILRMGKTKPCKWGECPEQRKRRLLWVLFTS